MRQVLGLLLASQAAALVVMPLVRPRVSFLSTSRTVMGAMEDAQEDDDGEKRLRKLKKGKAAFNAYIILASWLVQPSQTNQPP